MILLYFDPEPQLFWGFSFLQGFFSLSWTYFFVNVDVFWVCVVILCCVAIYLQLFLIPFCHTSTPVE